MKAWARALETQTANSMTLKSLKFLRDGPGSDSAGDSAKQPLLLTGVVMHFQPFVNFLQAAGRVWRTGLGLDIHQNF